MIQIIWYIIVWSQAIVEMKRLLTLDDDTQYRVGLELGVYLSILFSVYLLGVVLCFIRSVYKMLKHNPKKVIKICYIISAIAAFVGTILHIIEAFGIINYDDIYLLSVFPLGVLSFILGSIPIGTYTKK